MEDYELKADETAFNWMIPNSIYHFLKKDYSNIENLNTVKYFLVYRLAHDKIIDYSSSLYQKYNPIIEG